MKKTISITIGGVLFHIEEDGFDQLRQYLDEVHRYFASVADSREILNDIEARIAELFIARHTERNEAITADDVAEVVRIMGTVADFAAADATDEPFAEGNATSGTSASGAESQNQQGAQKQASGTTPPVAPLRRNLKDKMLGGVCSGIGIYLRIQAVWVRIIFLMLFFGLVWLPAFPAAMFVLYCALWISLPGEYLEQEKGMRQLFRSRKQKAIAGVCAGMATYLGIDTAVVRLLFLIAFFAFGTGFLLYMLLWIIIPEANSLMDEMKMEGTPINLASIESTVKRNLQAEGEQGESTLTRVILFPFRLIGQVISALGPIASALLKGLRIVAGAFLFLISLLSLVVVIVGTLAVLGVVRWEYVIYTETFPIQQAMYDLPEFSLYTFAFAAFMPMVLLLLLSVKLLFIQLRVPNWLVVSLFGLWVVSIGLAGVGGVRMAYTFREDGTVTKVSYLPRPTDKLQIKMALSDRNYHWSAIDLRVAHWEGDSIKIERIYTANGPSINQAERYATGITHNAKMEGNTLFIDGRYEMPTNLAFRDQQLTVVVYLPSGTEFVMDPNFATNWQNVDLETWDRGKVLRGAEFSFKGDTLVIKAIGSEVKGRTQAVADGDQRYRFRIKVGGDEVIDLSVKESDFDEESEESKEDF